MKKLLTVLILMMVSEMVQAFTPSEEGGIDSSSVKAIQVRNMDTSEICQVYATNGVVMAGTNESYDVECSNESYVITAKKAGFSSSGMSFIAGYDMGGNWKAFSKAPLMPKVETKVEYVYKEVEKENSGLLGTSLTFGGIIFMLMGWLLERKNTNLQKELDKVNELYRMEGIKNYELCKDIKRMNDKEYDLNTTIISLRDEIKQIKEATSFKYKY